MSDRKERATVDMINLKKRRLRSAVAAQENTELPEEALLLAWMGGGCSVYLGNIGSRETSQLLSDTGECGDQDDDGKDLAGGHVAAEDYDRKAPHLREGEDTISERGRPCPSLDGTDHNNERLLRALDTTESFAQYTTPHRRQDVHWFTEPLSWAVNAAGHSAKDEVEKRSCTGGKERSGRGKRTEEGQVCHGSECGGCPVKRWRGIRDASTAVDTGGTETLSGWNTCDLPWSNAQVGCEPGPSACARTRTRAEVKASLQPLVNVNKREDKS